MEAILVMFKADGQRREFPLAKPIMVVGRKHSCDLRIPISSVSREHCQVERKADGIYLRDLGSSNGTFANEARVQEVRLSAGDRITVGPCHFTVIIDGQPADIEKVCTVLPNGGEVEQPNVGFLSMDDNADVAASSGAMPAMRTDDSDAGSVVLDDVEIQSGDDDADDAVVFEQPARPAAPAPAPKPKPAPIPAAAKPAPALPKAPPAFIKPAPPKAAPPPVADDDDDELDPLAALAALAGGDDDDEIKDVNDVLADLTRESDDDDEVTLLNFDDEDDDKPKRR